MVKHLFEGTPESYVKEEIVKSIEENRSVIDKIDSLLQT
jgi:hypothetical protein